MAGKITNNAGKLQLQVSGSNDVLQLVPATPGALDAAALSGKTVIVAGEIPEAAKGKLPDTLRYNSIEEQK